MRWVPALFLLVLVCGCLCREQTEQTSVTTMTSPPTSTLTPASHATTTTQPAIVLVDPLLECKSIASELPRFECIIGVAVRTKNPRFCEQIDDFIYRNLCRVYVDGNPRLCYTPWDIEQPTYAFSLCYKQYAIREDRPDLCWPIKDDIISDECSIYFAVNHSEKAFCYNITNPDRRMDCLIDIAEAKPKHMPNEHYLRNCRWIGDTTKVGKCYSKLALRLKDSDICYLLMDKVSLDNCYLQYKARSESTSHCWKLVDVDNIVSCYGWKPGDLKEKDECGIYPTVNVRDACRLQVATYTKDASVCDVIEKEELRDECLEVVGG